MCIVFSLCCFANEGRFERIATELGPFELHITTIFQDSEGVLWFGTADGLYMYDGYQLTPFRHDPLNPMSISGNYIYSIDEDGSGFLWVVASGGGVNRFNRADGEFVHYHEASHTGHILSGENVTCVLADSKNRLWIGTREGGVNLYGTSSGQFSAFKYDPAYPAGLSSSAISIIYEDMRGDIWVGTYGGGLNRLTMDSLAVRPTHVLHLDAAPVSYSKNLYAHVDSLQSHKPPLASISRAGNQSDVQEFLSLSEATKMLVISSGEGDAYGMRDYSLIRDAGGNAIWEMQFDSTVFAGGDLRNRIQISLIELDAGLYSLEYKSDSKHAYASWESAAPYIPEWYGIRVFALNETQVRRIMSLNWRESELGVLPHDWVTDIQEIAPGEIWVGTAEGLAVMREVEQDQYEITTFSHNPRDPQSLIHSYVESIHQAGEAYQHSAWVRTAGGAVNLVDYQNSRIWRILYGGARSGGIAGKEVTAVHLDSKNALWLGTARDGLQRLKLEWHSRESTAEQRHLRFDLNRFKYDPANSSSLGNNEVTTLFEDRSGILWVGTRQGVYKRNLRHKLFKYYTKESGNSNSLSARSVSAVTEGPAGTFWVGTAGGGLNRIENLHDADTPDQYEVYSHDPTDPVSISSNAVTAVLYDELLGSEYLWVGTAAGLDRLDLGTGTFEHFKSNPNLQNSLAGNAINTLVRDQFGQLWVGTNSGISRLDRFTGAIENYTHDANAPNSLSHNEVLAIHEDRYTQGNVLWIGTRGGGLNKFERKYNHFTRYTREYENPGSLNNPAILSIHQDQAGDLWFGTYSGGLNRFSREKAEFTFITENDGLANNMIFDILEDQSGNLWLSTNGGLSRVNPVTLEIRNYDVNDGLQSNNFVAGASHYSSQGEMFFGGINGLNSFYPDSILDNQYLPPVILTAFNIYDEQKLDLIYQASRTENSIQLSHQQNFLSFEFAALDYTNPHRNQYTYMLEGFEDDWIHSGNRRFVAYTNLADGDYVFRVRASNSDGIWNDEGLAIHFSITPPFWQTWWFYLLAVALVVSGSVIFHKFRLRIKLRRILEIEQIRLLENERVRTKAAHDFHDELGHRLTKISLFSELVKRQLGQSSPEINDYLNRIGENAKSLSGGMRDFIWTLDPGKDTVHEMVVHLKDFGDTLFDKTGIAFRVEGLSRELEKTRLSMDWKRHLMLIFKEAMHNSLKHASCKNVSLMIDLKGQQLNLTLADDGVGVQQNQLVTTEEGFVVKESGNGSVGSARGNGLQNMQMRARKIEGDISFGSSNGSGFEIVFSGEIPKTGN